MPTCYERRDKQTITRRGDQKTAQERPGDAKKVRPQPDSACAAGVRREHLTSSKRDCEGKGQGPGPRGRVSAYSSACAAPSVVARLMRPKAGAVTWPTIPRTKSRRQSRSTALLALSASLGSLSRTPTKGSDGLRTAPVAVQGHLTRTCVRAILSASCGSRRASTITRLRSSSPQSRAKARRSRCRQGGWAVVESVLRGSADSEPLLVLRSLYEDRSASRKS